MVKPILFNTEMVKAILDGRKTVTRRINKDCDNFIVPDMECFDKEKRTYAVHEYYDIEHTVKCCMVERNVPICVGDILYVRETWCDDKQFTHDDTAGQYFYKADFPIPKYSDADTWKWHPSIHMPKEAARIWLKVIDVRVERLQDITEEQSIKEGFVPLSLFVDSDDMSVKARRQFIEVWSSTVNKEWQEWESNPYVWVIEFERCEKQN